MIHAYHLIWLLPLTALVGAFFGMLLLALMYAAREEADRDDS